MNKEALSSEVNWQGQTTLTIVMRELKYMPTEDYVDNLILNLALAQQALLVACLV